MGKKKHVAYVSTYTMGDEHGIKIYDVDMKNGRLKEKGEVLISNSSYVTISHNGKNLYSITDFGVESFAILKDGTLETINKASINGMRGCYLSTDYEDKYLFCAGYHDGKITVLKLDQETGAVGTITDEVYHKGLGSIAERSFRPHISCVKMTRDNKYLCAASFGYSPLIGRQNLLVNLPSSESISNNDTLFSPAFEATIYLPSSEIIKALAATPCASTISVVEML